MTETNKFKTIIPFNVQALQTKTINTTVQIHTIELFVLWDIKVSYFKLKLKEQDKHKKQKVPKKL